MRFDTSTRVAPGAIIVTVNPGNERPFATIDFDSSHYLRLHDLADFDEIIKAAVDGKRRLEATLEGELHPFQPDPHCYCEVCGQLKNSDLHAEPVITDSGRTCDQANPASGAWCHKSGEHTEHRDTDGETWTTAVGDRGARAALQDPAPVVRIISPAPEMCSYCDNEPATVTMTNGKFCEECAPAVQLATGADVEPASVTA